MKLIGVGDLLGARSGLLGLLLGSLVLSLFVDPVVKATSATCDLVYVELQAGDCQNEENE